MSRRIALIGPGGIGQAATRLLREAGHEIVAVIGRNQARAKSAARFIGVPALSGTDLAAAAGAEVILLALPDDHLGPTAARLRRSGHLTPGAVLVHFSGLHPAAILLGEEGPPLGALAIHPLQTFADAVIGTRNLPGTPCAIEGADHLIPLAEELVEGLGGRPFRIASEHKALYHAAASMASNYLVTLTNAACELLAGCGYQRNEAALLLSPLLRGTLESIATLGPVTSLTGPIARGDTRTVSRHLKALAEQSAEIKELYRVLGLSTVGVALAKGTLTPAGAAQLRDLLEGK
jgi:predicted short-subunit dehydrogenase-like oxidoreductase (DUF2520 family)